MTNLSEFDLPGAEDLNPEDRGEVEEFDLVLGSKRDLLDELPGECLDTEEVFDFSHFGQSPSESSKLSLKNSALPTTPNKSSKQSPSTFSKQCNLTNDRTRDRNAAGLFSGYGLKAGHKSTAKRMLNETDPTIQKPRWAVDGLVRLRDEGRCWGCRQPAYGAKGVVRQRIKGKMLGRGIPAYSEESCVLVCNECAKCWNSNRNFYLHAKENELEARKAELSQLTQLLWRRNNRYKGSAPLVESGQLLLKELLKELTELEERSSGEWERVEESAEELVSEREGKLLDSLGKLK